MGMIMHKELGPGCALGIWEITEDQSALLACLRLSQEERRTLDAFRNEHRKLEWLSVRALAGQVTGKQRRIVYNSENKPFFEDGFANISISHSRSLTAILVARDRKVGVDLEYMSHRINRIRDRFINGSEKITGNPVKLRYHLYIHWCAKESLYKMCDKRGINFRKNLVIEPFEPERRGSLRARVTGTGANDGQYGLEYFRLDNYIIVWSCKQE
jgi:4'-phosphopantetheinyl transferase